MTLLLDYTQRLNLHAMIGAQRGNLDELRIYWRLQDKLELDEREKKACNFRIEQSNGARQAMWDLMPNAAQREYEFSAEEVTCVANVIKVWKAGFSAGDRMWLQPLLQQLENTHKGETTK